MKQSLLVVDDDAIFNGLLRRQLEGMGFTAMGVGSWAAARVALKEFEPHAVILDFKLPDADAVEILPELSGQYPIIVLTGFGSIRNAVNVIHQGAADYLTKPVNLDELELTVRRVLENAQLKQSNQYYRARLSSRNASNLIGDSAAINDVRTMIEAAAANDTTVLILGESGTGKEMVARALHERSNRSSGDLVVVDSCGLQESLFESELFGHERGAFTGAERRKKGLIEEANGGTLFLDEIGDIGPAIQAKLLRVLENGSFRRVGATKTLSSDARFIAATNQDLASMSRDGRFRGDLYFRLSRFVINVPPLRERREDIPALVRHFLTQFSRVAPPSISSSGMDMLLAYDWPGNVRELRNAVERAMMLAPVAHEIGPAHLAFIRRGDDTGLTLRFAGEPSLEQIEESYLRQVLSRHGGNRQKTASVLGISERHVYRLIEKYGA